MSYQAPWWLPGGNLQTIYAALRSQRYLAEAPSFRRERWLTPDDDFVDVDFAQHATWASTERSEGPPRASSAPPGGSVLHEVNSVGAPLLVVFHGLEGSSASHYAEA